MCINEKDCEGHSPLKIIIGAILLVGYILTDALLQVLIEDGKREQARQNLEQIKYCYNRSVDTLSLHDVLDICTAKMKTSFTGDVYVLQEIEEDGKYVYKFIYETSKDIGVVKDVYFTKESAGTYFKDWSTAEIALKKMTLGKDSVPGTNMSYNFDGELEWIEWKYLPDDAGNSSKLIAVQGTQRDEVMARYTVYRMIGFGGVVLIVLTLLVANNVAIRRNNGCRKY